MASLSSQPPKSFPHIFGYTVTEQLYEGARTAVYRAVSATEKPVVIKVMRQSHPDFSELIHFRNQYAITKNLSIPGVVRALSLEPWQNGYALVMEDFGGVSLQQYIVDRALSLTEVLGIALQMADILQGLSQHRAIHKDIKPANVLIQPTSKRIQLIDFSIATLLPKETQEIRDLSGLEGTLAYLAPEQTGRMNRGIDYRTDFYGLGVTLYELLAGQLPFLATDPLELVHCHIAKTPVSVREANLAIPEMVSQLVLKLMAKNAEDRYQSALGLKHDLLHCLETFKDTGDIAEFELGQQDVSDRFLISEKLYGREREVQTLLEAFERTSRGSAELMLVAGYSGVGKTAVVNEVHKPITRQNGYFIKGKFDQFNRNIPFSAFVQAFRNLMGHLLGESDAQLASWKAKLLAALGDSGQAIVDVIPELERVLGKQPDVPELSGGAAQNRFNLLFGKFVKVFAMPEHPLVLFLDDLQWADSASLDLLTLLMSESSADADTDCLLVLGAYRDNEVFSAHPLTLTLNKLEKQGALINTLTLNPLSQSDISRLVADTLHCTAETVTPLAQLVYQKTQGNPFFSTQFLKGLHGEGCIVFNTNVGHWQCDLAEVRQLSLTDDVVEFMVRQLQQLPESTQTVLKLAACIGNRFELGTLAVVCDCSQEDIAADLWQALQQGLVIPGNDTYKFFQGSSEREASARDISMEYRFLHDRVQQAAYAFIPEDQKQVTHVQIGQLLLKNLSPEQQDSQIFEIVNHLNKGLDLPLTKNERLELLRLNCVAGKRAKEATAYDSAVIYFEVAKRLLPLDSQNECYAAFLDVHFSLAEVQYLSGNFQSSIAIVETLADAAKHPIEKAEVLNLGILQCTLQGKFLDALQYGQQALTYMNFDLAETNLSEKLESYQQEIRETLGDRTAEQLIHEPDSTDLEQQAVIKILDNLLVPVYILQKEDLCFVITLSIVSLSLKFGMTAESVCGFAFYGKFLGFRHDDYQSGYEFGVFSQALARRFGEGSYLCKAAYLTGNNLLSWVRPLRCCESILDEGLVAGLESGEWVFAGNILMYKPLNPFYAGDNILDIQSSLPQHLELATKTLNYQLPIDVMTGLAMWLADLTVCPDANLPTEQQYLDSCETNNSAYAICHYWILKAKVLCLYGDYEASLQAAQNGEEIIRAILGKYQMAALNFYQSIAAVEHCRRHNLESDNRYIQKVRSNQAILSQWMDNCPENFAHKHCLVAAVLNSFLGNRADAIELFDRAIAGAEANGYLQEEALANELTAQFYLDWGKEKVAAAYMQEAYYGYARWGAQAKVEALGLHYPTLLQPILQSVEQSHQTFNPLETIATIVSPSSSIHLSTKATRESTTSLNALLDLAAVLKASQVLSGTIELEDLLRQLTQIILQNSGGDRCALILADSADALQIKALATSECIDLCSEPLADREDLPLKLIQYVKNTQETVVIDNLETELPVVDAYLEESKPQSLLCLPLRNQSKLLGVLYLCNQDTRGAFTQERLHILALLCTQAAISLENARLYQQAQAYSQQLEQSQLTTIQAEKMASLGNLVAGVAHEINNPIGFLNGSLNNAKNYLLDLESQIALYQEHYPDPAEPIQENAEDIDLDFLLEDFPKLLSSMTAANQRIKAISTSLRTFSRADTEHKVSADLHEGLDSTLLILKYRLQGNDERPAIKVVQDYDKLPVIDCFPGQLNQVFMNLLANAIDVFDEAAESASSAELKEKGQIITIETRLCPDREGIEIRIGDNAKGMTEEVKTRVFDHLFTTKGVGKGTGLGLAIAQQIVVEKHGGRLTVESELGQGTEFCIQLPF